MGGWGLIKFEPTCFNGEEVESDAEYTAEQNQGSLPLPELDLDQGRNEVRPDSVESGSAWVEVLGGPLSLSLAGESSSCSGEASEAVGQDLPLDLIDLMDRHWLGSTMGGASPTPSQPYQPTGGAFLLGGLTWLQSWFYMP